MDKKTTGSWLVHHTNKLQKVDSQSGFSKIYVAGKSGILLSALAGDANIDITNDRVGALAQAANINEELELPVLLQKLKERDLIDIGQSGISVLGVSTKTVLERTAEIFEYSNPGKNELAAVSLAELASTAPITHEEAVASISGEFELIDADAQKLMVRSEGIGFVDAEQLRDSAKIYFNGNLFRRENPSKIKAVLDSLGASEQRSLNDVIEALKSRACLPFKDVERMLGESLARKVMPIGLFDVNVVSNTLGDTAFVTLPAAFNKYSSSMVDDAFDLAKAFVSSITYGMTLSNSSRGKIELVRDLLKALVRGEPVGPAPAIAQDYKILELKGVVQVYQGTKDGYYGKRHGWLMRLKKKEIGEIALQVIQEGAASEQSLTALPSATITRYRGPEESRTIIRRKQLEVDPAAASNILNVLRFGRDHG